MLSLFTNTFIKFFFLLTPFFVMSTFLALTRELGASARRNVVGRIMIAVLITCVTLFVVGNYLFAVLGITVDAFRLGAGALLFLSAVSLVRGRRADDGLDANQDIAVVPLAIPVTVGPATTGALLVMSGELDSVSARLVGGGAMLAAILCVGVLLYISSAVEKLLGQKGLTVLSKLTGLILAAMSAQMAMQGVKNFFMGAS